MATISGITGKQYTPGTQEYEDFSYQYATSTYGVEHDMNPGLIVQPKTKDDIVLTIKYAKANKIAIAIRTGGHQYCGASSTSARNIQLDLRSSFRSSDDRTTFEKEGQAFVRTSVSWSLGEFNEWLTANHLFVPHGQCADVHLGGHVQTGGYGQLLRSFGLLADHVISLEIVDHNGDFKEITKTNNPDLFFGFLGGSPGNLGVLTHFTIQVHRDQDYEGSLGMKALYLYDTGTLKRLLDIMVEMSEDVNLPRNYDLCVSVLSSSFPLLDIWPGLDEKMAREHPEIYGQNELPFWPRTILVYAQWVKLSPDDVCDMDWFDQLKMDTIAILGKDVVQKPMSEMTGMWIFGNVREFEKPYVKRAYLSNSTTLRKDGWADWAVERIDDIVRPQANKCWLASQIQCSGGKNSKLVTNAGNGTAFSWRDSTMGMVLDCFHNPEEKQRAEDWAQRNDREAIGPNGIFGTQDRRQLWGSYGSYNLDEVAECYYDSKEKYERLQRIRKEADPDGTFTPNTFCVKSAS